jgi:lysine 2,3-aminomutase
MGEIMIVESKTISDYLKQLQSIGEDIAEYDSLWGYSMGETEERMPIYEYPGYDFEVSEEMTNFEMAEDKTV